MTSTLQPADLAAIHLECFVTPRPWSQTEFTGLLGLSEVFLTTSDGPAFAMGRIAATEVELLTIAVSPSAQGQGFGRAAMLQFESQAATLGAKEIFLEVSAENDVAIKLYTSLGYTESGIRPQYYSTPRGRKIDALVMMKPLI
jgi:ribosomal-protein-alanine N-acetyltransferase